MKAQTNEIAKSQQEVEVATDANYKNNEIVFECNGKSYQLNISIIKDFIVEHKFEELVAVLDDLKSEHIHNFPDEKPSGQLKIHLQAIFEAELILGSLVKPANINF